MGEDIDINTIKKEIETLTKESDTISIQMILFDMAMLKTEPIDKEQLIKTIANKTQQTPTTIKKQLESEAQKIKTYRKTTTEKPFGIFADKRELAQRFHEEQPYFYDKKRIWWFWNKGDSYYEITDETDLLNQLTKYSANNTIRSTEKNEIIEALKQIGRTKIPREPPRTWIQFRNKIIDIRPFYDSPGAERATEASPEYFITNPIPWTIGETSDTPIMDKLFIEWVGEKNKESLYELLAYCCYPSYPIQLLFSLWGNGRNGKTQYMKILDKFIGTQNTTSTELDILLNNRFESFKLYKKLVCSIGETNFGILSNTSLIKKLTGGDKIGFEKKNKDPFDDYNYAKMIIASNSLPSTEDTSDGFFRRWLIIDFPNEFEDVGKEVWEEVPDKEYEALARKVTDLLPALLKRGTFTGQGTIPDRKKKYISVSNPLSLFITERCEVNDESMVLSNLLYTEYVKYLLQHKRRKVKVKEFKGALEDEGFYIEKTNRRIGVDENGYGIYKSGYFVIGLSFLEDWDNRSIRANVSTQIPLHENLSENKRIMGTNVTMQHIKEYIDLHKEDNKILLFDTFGEKKILDLIQNGSLYELPSGTIRHN